MDEVHGGIFIRFAEVLVRCLCFHFSPYVVYKDSIPALLPACREQQGGKGKRKLWGLCPQPHLENKKI